MYRVTVDQIIVLLFLGDRSCIFFSFIFSSDICMVARYYLLQVRRFVYAGFSVWVADLLASPICWRVRVVVSTPGRDMNTSNTQY